MVIDFDARRFPFTGFGDDINTSIKFMLIRYVNSDSEHGWAGGDAKLLAVPIDKVLPIYKHWREAPDMQPELLAQIKPALVARKGRASISKIGSSLASAEIRRSPIGAWPVRTARKISSPLNRDPPGWVTTSSSPPEFCVTSSANAAATASASRA